MGNSQKQVLRKEILTLRNGIPEEERKRADFLITETVLGHNWFQAAEKLLVYVNTGSEVSTEQILEEAFRRKKQVFAPKVRGEEMEFYRITSFAQLEKGFQGIREPVEGLEEYEYHEETDATVLMLMPGVVFDRSRNRIGYGKGYYDKYLEDKPKLRKMALAYESQIVESFDAQEHDCRPDVVITQAQKKGGFQEWI